jgi:hypothetical protein
VVSWCWCGIRVDLDQELPVDDDVWGEVVVHANEHASDHLVDKSSDLMEAGSLTKESLLFVWTGHLGGECWWGMHNALEFIVHQRLIVHVTKINDYLEGDEVDDAVSNRALESQHEQVKRLADESKRYLNQTKDIGDLVTTLDKQVVVLVGQLHNVETF